MSLPKLGIPYYDLELISGKKVRYRPFTVREEKALLLASEAKNKKSLSQAVKNTLLACVQGNSEEEKIDIDSLPMYDIEYLFLHIRMASVGESSDFNYTCESCEGSPTVKVKLNMNNLRIENKDTAVTRKLMLSDNIGVELQYPPFRVFANKGMTDSDSNPTAALDLIGDCIVTVFDENSTYTRKDFTEREIQDFIESLTQEHLKKMNEFFDKVPKIEYDLEVQCPCGTVEKKTLSGLADFFS
jgi:hypothetical protein